MWTGQLVVDATMARGGTMAGPGRRAAVDPGPCPVLERGSPRPRRGAGGHPDAAPVRRQREPEPHVHVPPRRLTPGAGPDGHPAGVMQQLCSASVRLRTHPQGLTEPALGGLNSVQSSLTRSWWRSVRGRTSNLFTSGPLPTTHDALIRPWHRALIAAGRVLRTSATAKSGLQTTRCPAMRL